jgi:MFS family permease
MKTEEADRSSGFKISLNNMIDFEVIVPAIIMFFLGGTYSCINTFIVVYGSACGVEDIGLFFTAYAICLLFTRPISGRIADKYGIDKTVVPGIIIFAISFIIVSFSRTLPMFIIAGAVSAFGYGICQPSIQSLCMSLVPKERRGIAGNTNYMGVDTGYLLVPPLAGSIVTFVQQSGGSKLMGYTIMYRIMTVPILIALVIFLLKKDKLIKKN